jgi:imidazolonepropionase-like amidohydrolase
MLRALAGVVVALYLSGLARPEPSSLVLYNANVIDGVSEEPAFGVSVVVVNGRIAGVGPNQRVPSGATQIDLGGRWLMPGLIDAHTHVDTLAAARAALASGVTTLRTMNVYHYVDIGMRALHRAGRRDLPDVLAGGYQLRPDMFEEFFLDHPALADMMPRVSGAANARRLVRANAARGVDYIKILATERGGTPETDPKRRTWTDEELSAIVDEARRHGLSVVAHAHGDEGAAAAIRAGVREIHHGSFMTDATISLLKASRACLVTTGAVYDTVPAALAEQNRAFWERTLETKRAASAVAARAWNAGVTLVPGTDGDYVRTPGFTLVSELDALVAAGVPAMATLRAATSRAAKCAGLSDRTGAIQRGLEADLIAVDGDPRRDPGALRRLVLVVNDGHIAVNSLGASPR